MCEEITETLHSLVYIRIKSDDLVQRVFDNSLSPQLDQFGHDLSHFLFVEDAFDGDPIGVIEVGDGRIVEARQYFGDGVDAVVRRVHLETHHIFGSRVRP